MSGIALSQRYWYKTAAFTIRYLGFEDNSNTVAWNIGQFIYKNNRFANRAKTENISVVMTEEIEKMLVDEHEDQFIEINMCWIHNDFVKLASEAYHAAIHEEISVSSDGIKELAEFITKYDASNKLLRKCKRCGKYFVPNQWRSCYCDFIGEDGKTCREVGGDEAWKRHLEEDKAMGLYRQFYKMLYSRFRDGTLSGYTFEVWKENAKKKLQEVKDGKLTVEEYEAWLDKYRRNRKRGSGV